MKYILTFVVYVICWLFLIALLIFLFTGCATKPVPVAYDCPTLELPADPVPATRKLTDKSRPDEVIKAYVKTVRDYVSWNQVVRAEVETSK